MAEYAVPTMPSRDLYATLGFYERLGFESIGEPPERWGYVILRRGGIQLHFFEDADLDPLTTAHGCYVYVEDADALHTEWDDIGVPNDPVTGSRLQGPVSTDYGLREFALVDPSGNLLRVGSPPLG